jgi:hypothetical protein
VRGSSECAVLTLTLPLPPKGKGDPTRAWSLENFLANRPVVATAGPFFKLHKIAGENFFQKKLACDLVL